MSPQRPCSVGVLENMRGPVEGTRQQPRSAVCDPRELDLRPAKVGHQIRQVTGQVVHVGLHRGGSRTNLSYSNADAKRCDSELLSATQRIRAFISERGAAIC
jgi:hypothetical protein